METGKVNLLKNLKTKKGIMAGASLLIAVAGIGLGSKLSTPDVSKTESIISSETEKLQISAGEKYDQAKASENNSNLDYTKTYDKTTYEIQPINMSYKEKASYKDAPKYIQDQMDENANSVMNVDLKFVAPLTPEDIQKNILDGYTDLKIHGNGMISLWIASPDEPNLHASLVANGKVVKINNLTRNSAAYINIKDFSSMTENNNHEVKLVWQTNLFPITYTIKFYFTESVILGACKYLDNSLRSASNAM
jgi:hypothetical protein